MNGPKDRFDTVLAYSEKGKRVIKQPKVAWKHALSNISEHIERKYNYGINYLNHEWDHLVVLDACRYDLFTEFAPKHSVYGSFTSVESVYSNASSTPVWLKRNFEETNSSKVKDIYYISSTPHVTDIDTVGFKNIIHVWEYSHDPEAHVPRPEPVTDAAIESYRNDPSKRSIIHYVQPHAPFLHCVGKYDSQGNRDGGTLNVWREMRKGNVDAEEVWMDYGQNLLTVLDEVEKLIENLGGDIVVTSDHGNAFGEYGIYGHPPHVPLPSIRRVPWVKTTGNDKRSYNVKGKEEMSEAVAADSVESQSREEQLKALGYKV